MIPQCYRVDNIELLKVNNYCHFNFLQEHCNLKFVSFLSKTETANANCFVLSPRKDITRLSQ